MVNPHLSRGRERGGREKGREGEEGGREKREGEERREDEEAEYLPEGVYIRSFSKW